MSERREDDLGTTVFTTGHGNRVSTNPRTNKQRNKMRNEERQI